MQRNIQHFYKILLFILLSVFSFQSAFATGSKTVSRGTVVTIAWSITNPPAGDKNCTGSTNYRDTNSNIYTNWTLTNNGVHPIDANGNGSLQLGAANEVGTSTFKCTNYTSNPPASDSTTLIVNDCSGATSFWNGTACVAPSPCYQGQSKSHDACLYKLGGTTNSGNTVNLPNVTTNYTGSANVTCTNGTLSFAGTPSCKKTSCDLPWGGSIASGTSVTAYSSKTVDPPTTCTDVSQTLTCKTGVLSGNTTTYKYPSCSVNGSNSLNFSPSTCTIAVGASTCTVSASWTTAPSVTSPNLFDANPNSITGIISQSASSTGTTVTVAGGGTTFQLRDGTSVLLSKTITPSCESGSTWDGAVCKSDTTPSSSNSLDLPASCIIADGASTCTVLASWTTAPSVTSPNLFDNNVGKELSMTTSGTAFTVWVAKGGTTFQLRDGTNVLLSKTVTAECGTNSSWDNVNNVCKSNNVLPPSGNCTNGATNPPTCDQFSCQNNAINPPDCNQCATDFAYINGACIACTGESGCHGGGGNVGDPLGTLICDNSGKAPNANAVCGSLPASISSFKTEPRTSTLGGYTVVSWDIKNPAPGACTIAVKTVCGANPCTADQNTSATSLQSTLQSALDATMGTVSSPVSEAIGRKSIQVKYTTDFTLSCGASSRSTQFLVTKNHEG